MNVMNVMNVRGLIVMIMGYVLGRQLSGGVTVVRECDSHHGGVKGIRNVC